MAAMSKSSRKWLLVQALQILAFAIAGTLPTISAPRYPSPATFWDARQYTDFYFVHFNTHLALPHLRNPESRALFERVIDPDNVERILATAVSRQDKQRQLAMILSAVGGIRASYNLAVVIGEPLQEELTRVQVFHLYLIGIMSELADTPIARANGASAMKTAWLGVMQSLSQGGIYSSAQIAALSDAASRRYPALSELFSDEDRTRLRDQLAMLQNTQTAPESRRALARLLATVSNE
jgi:hypothetical protein